MNDDKLKEEQKESAGEHIGGHDPQAQAGQREMDAGERLAKQIRAKLGPYNDDERDVTELIGVLLNDVHAANRYRQMVEHGHEAARTAMGVGDPQRAVDILFAATRPFPQQQPRQRKPEGGRE